MDIQEKVRAAFQVEHKEQLDQIRQLIGGCVDPDAPVSVEQIQEAFRMAHSLKGGARLCGLKPAEQLGHGLEAVFEQVQAGSLKLNAEVHGTILESLDAIEDWMLALRDGDPLPPSNAILERLGRLRMPGGQSPGTATEGRPEHEQLAAAFLREFSAAAQMLRALAAESAGHRDEFARDEMLRLANNLTAGAVAAGFERVVPISRELEGLVAGFGSREANCEGDAQRLLDLLERFSQSLGKESACGHRPSGDRAAAADRSPLPGSKLPGNARQTPPGSHALNRSAAGEPLRAEGRRSASTATAPTFPKCENVRVSTSSLDNLLSLSRELICDCFQQQTHDEDLLSLEQLVGELHREFVAYGASVNGKNDRLTSPESRLETLARSVRQLRVRRHHETRILRKRARQLRAATEQTRLVPASGVFQGLRKMIRDLAADEGREIQFLAQGFEVRADRSVLQALKDPLIHILRNCLIHGIEPPQERTQVGKPAIGRISLALEVTENRLKIDIRDDGRGINFQRIRQVAADGSVVPEVFQLTEYELLPLIFQPGLSTFTEVTEIAGRGMGLSVVKEAITRLQGEIHVATEPHAGTTFQIDVPLALSTHRLLMVRARRQTFAIPLRCIEQLQRVRWREIPRVEGRPVVLLEGRPLPLVSLNQALGLSAENDRQDDGFRAVVILRTGGKRVAVCVDELGEEQESVIQSLGPAAARPIFAGAVSLDDSSVALVLNPVELVASVAGQPSLPPDEMATEHEPADSLRVLVVDDSFTTRLLEKNILEACGYQVELAVDGEEALTRMRQQKFDLVLSDIEMPRRDGFSLLTAIKQEKALCEVPVILVTSCDRPDQQRKGLELGANAYIVKRRFDHQHLLETIARLVRRPSQAMDDTSNGPGVRPGKASYAGHIVSTEQAKV